MTSTGELATNEQRWSLTWSTYKSGIWIRCASGCDRRRIGSLLGEPVAHPQNLKKCLRTSNCIDRTGTPKPGISGYDD